MFIGFTGLDGAGKSTQSAKLSQFLRSLDRQCYVSESKDDLVAQTSQAIAKKYGRTHRNYFGAYAFELSKAFSSVRFHFSVIQPMLIQGIDIIDPRTNNCRLQLARSHGCENIDKVSEIYNLIQPYDLLFFIKIDPLIAYERINKRGTDCEVLEELISFNNQLEEKTPDFAIAIDGNQEADIIFDNIRKRVLDAIAIQGKRD
jgi:thymidylate kinase